MNTRKFTIEHQSTIADFYINGIEVNLSLRHVNNHYEQFKVTGVGVLPTVVQGIHKSSQFLLQRNVGLGVIDQAMGPAMLEMLAHPIDPTDLVVRGAGVEANPYRLSYKYIVDSSPVVPSDMPIQQVATACLDASIRHFNGKLTTFARQRQLLVYSQI